MEREKKRQYVIKMEQTRSWKCQMFRDKTLIKVSLRQLASPVMLKTISFGLGEVVNFLRHNFGVNSRYLTTSPCHQSHF